MSQKKPANTQSPKGLTKAELQVLVKNMNKTIQILLDQNQAVTHKNKASLNNFRAKRNQVTQKFNNVHKSLSNANHYRLEKKLTALSHKEF